MEMLQIAGWFLLVVGGLLVLGAIIAVFVFVFFAGALLLGGGKFTEALGSILVGAVVVVVALILGIVALFFSFILINLKGSSPYRVGK